MVLAGWFQYLLLGYAIAGVIFAVRFVTAGIEQIDPVAGSSGMCFRLMILPGVATLWPLLLLRWRDKRRQA
jgi:hypothetical protein